MAKYNLRGRVVAITGSTGGLGAAVSRALVAKGATVALFDIDRAALEAQVRALGDGAFAHEADVRSLESINRAMSAAAQHFGGLDIIVANAGVDYVEPLISADPEKFERAIDINLTGVWRTFHAGLPHVMPRKGYLMAISSMAAFVHSPLQAHYTASKAGVWAMCDSIRLEVRHLGVGVGSVHPTFFQTPMMEAVHANDAGLKLWNGNQGGLWKMVTLENVVAGILRGIERRSDMVVLPKQNTLVAKAPGFFRSFVETIGFKQSDIKEAIALSVRR
ncbi:short-chain dehydrogenase [Cupriavidus sp. TA19]|uniref:SDR family NAD(P)-dependent oxidoreductase n=1 Tax=Cupriavidus sp. TA19 TaxID=701108 RepID=UPI0027294A5D|nr:SDR family NAD(P)-dependent oxidoreductase [Cupriavidus sp. TA19]GLC91093.1 short-chain dehydrogenase [Cupriavidus sp. TA19]